MFEFGVTLLDANIEHLIRVYEIPTSKKHLVDLETLYLFRTHLERERPRPRTDEQQDLAFRFAVRGQDYEKVKEVASALQISRNYQ